VLSVFWDVVTSEHLTPPLLGRFLVLGSAAYRFDEDLLNCWVENTRTVDTPLLGWFLRRVCVGLQA
jgi:hypothetical protein